MNSRDELPTFSPVENPIIHKRFEMQANQKADDVALVASDATLTYGELNEKSNRIANALIKNKKPSREKIRVYLLKNFFNDHKKTYKKFRFYIISFCF